MSSLPSRNLFSKTTWRNRSKYFYGTSKVVSAKFIYQSMINVCFSIMNYFKWKKGANTTVKIKVKSRREDVTERGETEEAWEKKEWTKRRALLGPWLCTVCSVGSVYILGREFFHLRLYWAVEGVFVHPNIRHQGLTTHLSLLGLP